MDNVAIRVEHLSKMYRLGVINNGTLWKDIQTWAALKMGKEDPHSKIGEDKYSGDEDHFWALKDVSFDIKQGDRVGIIGKNGAGKSTLLKLLSRVTAPTEGVIKVRGKISSLLEVGTGFNGELTGRENIYLNGAILGMKKRQIDRKIDEIIDFSEIEHHIDTPVKRYSSGMYVRLAFAVAAHLDSDILIADEVLAVGDASFQKKALGKMKDLSTGQGRTVLFVSHQMTAVKNLCSKGIILDRGRISKTADIDTCIDSYMSGNKTTIMNDGYVSLEQSHDLCTIEKVFNSIKLSNELGITKNIFRANEELNIEVLLNNINTRIDLAFCVAVTDSYGKWITSVATWMFNSPIPNDPKKLFVHIKRLPLATGRYYLYLSCTQYTAGKYIDKVENAINFEVIGSDIFGTGRSFSQDDGVVLPFGNIIIQGAE